MSQLVHTTNLPAWYVFIWRHPVVHYPDSLIHPIVLKPLPGYPHGNKGAAMRQVWVQSRAHHPGIVFLDGDVAVDPWDLRAMNRAVLQHPRDVVAGHAWLWPASLKTGNPVPSHRSWQGKDAVWGATHADGQIDYFSFNCTYIPNRLFERVEQEKKWGSLVFPWADTRLSEIAQQHPRIPMYYEPQVKAKHLNAW